MHLSGIPKDGEVVDARQLAHHQVLGHNHQVVSAGAGDMQLDVLAQSTFVWYKAKIIVLIFYNSYFNVQCVNLISILLGKYDKIFA